MPAAASDGMTSATSSRSFARSARAVDSSMVEAGTSTGAAPVPSNPLDRPRVAMMASAIRWPTAPAWFTMPSRTGVACWSRITQPSRAEITIGTTKISASVRRSRRNWATMRRMTATTRRGFMPRPAVAPGSSGSAGRGRRGRPGRRHDEGAGSPASSPEKRRNASSRLSVPARRRSSPPVPWAKTLPDLMNSSSSQRSASSITWLVTSSVAPSAARARKCRQNCTRSAGSIPTVGSSSTRIGGRCTSAQASESRRRIPPDSWSAGVSSRSASSTTRSVSTSRARSNDP